ncbi:MAG: VWA domain-containing protein [Acidobacteriota bacterium]
MGRIRHKSAFLMLAAVAAGLALAQKADFSVSTKLVRLLVSVKDDRGDLIGTLEKANFKVQDSGVSQDIAVFEHHTELPLSISLLIDTSGSTAKDLRYEVESLQKFLRALLKEGNPQDAASIYSFNDQVTLLTSFTRREQRLLDSLARLRATSGTSMYDAIYLASRELEDREGRHVMIVVTDGGDTTSNQKFQQARKAAQFAEATIYPILVTPITNEPGRNLGGERALSTLATDTGGRVFEPAVSTQLDRIFTEILRDLRSQYLIGYYPHNLPPDVPEFHLLKVEVNRPGLRVSTRSGYYGDTTAPR